MSCAIADQAGMYRWMGTVQRSLAAIAMLLGGVNAHASEHRGEIALRSSLYLNTVPSLVEAVTGAKKEIFDALELPSTQRRIIEKALDETWTAQRIYAHAAIDIEKRLSAQELDAAIAQMTTEVQAMIKAGIGEPSREELQAWLIAARKHADAKEREVLARRIAAHLPKPEVFKELFSQAVDLFADTAQVATGTDDIREELRSTLNEGLAPALQAMERREALVVAAVAAYRDQPTAKMKLFADALDSESGRKLQKAAAESLVTGAKRTRREVVERLEKELNATLKGS